MASAGSQKETASTAETERPSSRAPSWSWASIDGEFHAPDVDYDGPDLVPVTDIVIDQFSTPQGGLASHGRLTIDWLLFEAYFHPLRFQEDERTADCGYLTPLDPSGRARLPRKLMTLDVPHLDYRKDRGRYHDRELPWVHFDREIVDSTQHIVCMPVVHNSTLWHYDTPGVRGLILEPSGKQRGAYRRRGLCSSPVNKLEQLGWSMESEAGSRYT